MSEGVYVYVRMYVRVCIDVCMYVFSYVCTYVCMQDSLHNYIGIEQLKFGRIVQYVTVDNSQRIINISTYVIRVACVTVEIKTKQQFLEFLEAHLTNIE